MTAGPRCRWRWRRLTRRLPVHPPPRQRNARERLFNPIVVSAGTLKTRDGEIHLAGIAAPEFEAMCGEKPAALALRAHGAGGAAELHPPPRHRMHDPRRSGQDSRSRRAARSAATTFREWLVSHRAGRSGTATRFEDEEKQGARCETRHLEPTRARAVSRRRLPTAAAEPARRRAPCRSGRASPQCRRSPRTSRSAARAPARAAARRAYGTR